ncbi:MAG: hypothetical protein AAGF96_07445 [Bacteroidota bacterium]
MSIFKKIILVIFILLLTGLVGGTIYFDKKFSPPENYLTVENKVDTIPIKWVAQDKNPYAALLLPVTIEGIDFTFFMQLDFGSPITVFYKKSLASIEKKFPEHISLTKDATQVHLDVKLKDLTISSDRFRILNYGNAIHFENRNDAAIIGTIGTDLLEKRIIDLDLKNNLCSFKEKINEDGFSDFQFKKRRILLPAKLENQELNLLYDSGTSGYELITDKEKWNSLRNSNGKIKTEKGNSWGKELQVITAPTNLKIQLGTKDFILTEITHIKGTSKIQNFLMKTSGMEGMIGNKLFLNHRVIIDCKREKFIVQ